jgi:hypothetical protein
LSRAASAALFFAFDNFERRSGGIAGVSGENFSLAIVFKLSPSKIQKPSPESDLIQI